MGDFGHESLAGLDDRHDNFRRILSAVGGNFKPRFYAIESDQLLKSALPLIALPGISPRKREKEAGRNAGILPTVPVIGEIAAESVLLPVHGEKMAAAR